MAMEATARPQPPPTPPSLQRTTSDGTILLGKYKLGRVLGRGSFAKVQQAQSMKSDDVVAIKIIDKSKTVDAAMEPRILREVDAMRRLHHHPNILKIHEVMATKSKIYLVMELASGGELFAKVLRRGRLQEPAARKYFQQLASALRFCHQNGVAHRDLKPQNLLLDRSGNLKVSDFGLSALPDQLQNGLLQTACGTPAYTAPEVVTRKGYDGAKADAWSCGVILFVLLAGCLPFDDANLVSMYKKIHRREFKFPDWISKPARSVIFKLLDPNPSTRISIEAVTETNWFKRSLQSSNHDYSLFDSKSLSCKETKINHETTTAFDLISLSSGLDLSGLFESKKRTETRFTARVTVEEVMEKVREVGEKLSYKVERRKGGGVAATGLRRDGTVVVVEAMDIAAAAAVVVEVKVVEGEEEEAEWEKLKLEIGEIVHTWHNHGLQKWPSM